MNMSRRMRGHELLHRRLAKLINDLPENLDTRRSNLAEEMNHIRHNLSELADNMALNGIHGGSELSKRVRTMNDERRSQRSYEENSSVNVNSMYQRELKRLSDQADASTSSWRRQRDTM